MPADAFRADAFVDTNILIYAFATDDARAAPAALILSRRPAMSVQVLNEFAAVCRRKQKLPWEEIATRLAVVRDLCSAVLPLTLDLHSTAMRLAATMAIGVYDALIVAAALQARCTILWSEDMQDGRLIDDRLTVRNPFVQRCAFNVGRPPPAADLLRGSPSSS